MLSKYYIYQNADTASSLIENQIALAENSKSDYWLSRIYNAKGVFLTYKGDRNEARKALQQAILHYKVIGDTTNLIHTSFNLAANNIDLGCTNEQKKFPVFLSCETIKKNRESVQRPV